MSHIPHLLPKVRSPLIMASAQGQSCTLRIASFIPGMTCAGPNTSVGAHLTGPGKGMATKETDLAVSYACCVCHDIIDGRNQKALDFIMNRYPAAYGQRLLSGLIETHALLNMAGILIVKDQ